MEVGLLAGPSGIMAQVSCKEGLDYWKSLPLSNPGLSPHEPGFAQVTKDGLLVFMSLASV